MTPEGWTLHREPPTWLVELQPVTTGLLGQEGVRLWTHGGVAVGIRAGGVVYPVFPENVDCGWEAGARALLAQVSESWCVMGPSKWVARAETLMPPSVVQHRVEYDFLVCPAGPVDLPPGPGVLRKATASDGNALYPLQEAYEKEEVLFREADFQPLACRLHLGKVLKTQEIVGLWENGHPVAKAGTNALTSTWAQIGGVYTRPEHRGQGHQKRLMAFLIRRLSDEGRRVCLFVKKTNRAAFSLYRSLGFQSSGPFSIIYGDRRSTWAPSPR